MAVFLNSIQGPACVIFLSTPWLVLAIAIAITHIAGPGLIPVRVYS
jgi:hypothetical protein